MPLYKMENKNRRKVPTRSLTREGWLGSRRGGGRSGEELCTAPGWLGEEGDEQGGGTPSLNLQSQPLPQEASSSSRGTRTQPPPMLRTLLPSHILHPPPGPRLTAEGGACTPLPGRPDWPPALRLSGPPRPGPWGWPGRSASLCRPSDLQVPSPSSPEPPPLRGALGPPAPPGSQHKSHQDLRLGDSDQLRPSVRPDQVKPTYPGGPCPGLPSAPSSAGLGEPSSLEVHPLLPSSRHGAVHGERGMRPGLASPLATESQSQSPRTPLGPARRTPWVGSGLERAAVYPSWAVGEPMGPPPPPAMGPSLRHSWTHPVSSTLSPHAVLVQAAPLY